MAVAKVQVYRNTSQSWTWRRLTSSGSVASGGRPTNPSSFGTGDAGYYTALTSARATAVANGNIPVVVANHLHGTAG